jgi:hypothetical protein
VIWLVERLLFWLMVLALLGAIAFIWIRDH